MLLFQNHFNWEQHYFNQDELNLKQTQELFKQIDDKLWNECDKSIYKPCKFRKRKLKTKRPINL